MSKEEMERIRVSLASINMETGEIQKVLGTVKETLLERPNATCVISVGPLMQNEDVNQDKKIAEIIFVYGRLFDIQYRKVTE